MPSWWQPVSLWCKRAPSREYEPVGAPARLQTDHERGGSREVWDDVALGYLWVIEDPWDQQVDFAIAARCQ